MDQSLPLAHDDDERDALRASVLSGAHRVFGELGSAVTIAASGVIVAEGDYCRAPALGGRCRGRRHQRHFARSPLPRLSKSSEGRARRGLAGGLAQPWSHPAFEGSDAPNVTVIDGHPHTPAWLPGALGRRGATLGVTGFGRSGTSAELYREFAIDAEAIVTAAVSLLDP